MLTGLEGTAGPRLISYIRLHTMFNSHTVFTGGEKEGGSEEGSGEGGGGEEERKMLP